MTTTDINVRVDTDLKQSAEALFNDLGLNMSSAITMFLRCAVNYGGIPFAVKRMIPSAETIAALAEYKAMRNDSDSYKRYDSFDELVVDVSDNE